MAGASRSPLSAAAAAGGRMGGAMGDEMRCGPLSKSAIIWHGPKAFSAHHPYRSARACFLRLSLSAGVKGLERRAARREGNRKG